MATPHPQISRLLNLGVVEPASNPNLAGAQQSPDQEWFRKSGKRQACSPLHSPMQLIKACTCRAIDTANSSMSRTEPHIRLRTHINQQTWIIQVSLPLVHSFRYVLVSAIDQAKHHSHYQLVHIAQMYTQLCQSRDRRHQLH